MEKQFKNIAFISYNHQDTDAAKKLHRKLESFKLPNNIHQAYPDIPVRLREVFRDIDGLCAGGDLNEQIKEKLKDSKHLIVICSPNSSKSEWVDKEVQYFKDLGRSHQIIPFIISGQPYSLNVDECFSPTMHELREEGCDLASANINDHGFEHAFIKLVAGILGLEFDSLWQRHQRQERIKRRIYTIVGVTILLLSIGLTLLFAHQKNEIDKNMDGMLMMQSKFVTEKASAESNPIKALAMLLAVLPEGHDDDSRPYSPEAASALMNFLDSTRLEYVFPHKSEVICFKFSPDGTKLLTGSNDRTACLWDLQTKKKLVTFGDHDSRVRNMVFSPDGTRVFIASEYSWYLWDVKTGEKLFELKKNDDKATESLEFIDEESKILVQSWCEVFVIDCNTSKEVFAKDTKNKDHYIQLSGAHVINGSDILIWTEEGEISVIDIKDGYNEKISHHHNAGINSLTFSQDSTNILIASENKSATILDAQSLQEILILKGHEDIVNTAVFSPDGKRILTSSDDKTARIWDAHSGKELMVLKGHENIVRYADYNPDGTHILTESNDETAILWDAKTGQRLITMEEPKTEFSSFRAGFSHDGTKILTSNEYTTSVWDIKTLERSAHFIGKEIQTSPSGCIILLDNEGIVSLQKVPAGNSSCKLQMSVDVNDFIFAHDNNCKKLITAGVPFTNSYLNLWDAKTGKKILTLNPNISTACFSPDDSKILGLMISQESVCILDADTGDIIHTLPHKNVNSAIYTPDGSRIISKARNDLYVWDASTGRKLKSYDSADNHYKLIKSCLDGSKVLMKTSFLGSKVSLMDLNTGKELLTLDYMKEGTADYEVGVREVDLSSDGNRIAVALGEKVHIINAHTGEYLFELRHENVTIAKFSPNNQLILTGNGRTLHVWDAETGEMILVLDGISSIKSAGFSSDGGKIFATSWDGKLKFWNVPDFDENVRRGLEVLNGYKLPEIDLLNYNIEQ